MQIGNKQWKLEESILLTWIFALITVFGLTNAIVSLEDSIRLTEESLISQPPIGNAVIVPSKESPTEKVCLSTECIHTASTVLWKMNPVVDPCDDFYQFACGTFIEEEAIPDGQNKLDSFSLTIYKIEKQLQKIITEKQPKTTARYLKLPKIFYEACMNETLIEQLDSAPMAHIAKSLGGWPVVEGDSWNADKTWSWQETIKKFRQLGFSANYIIDLSIGVDLENRTRRIITFDQSDFHYNPGDLVKGLNNSVVQLYFDYIIDVAVLFGADKNRAEVELRESLDFEIALANISWSYTYRHSNALYNLRTIKELQVDYPYLNWLNYTNSLLTEKMQVNEDEPVNIAVPSFFEKLGILLRDTSSRVISNYLMLQIHISSMEFLSQRFDARKQKFNDDKMGQSEREPRWKKCIRDTTDKLGIIVGSQFVRKYFNNDSKDLALEMFTRIHGNFYERLSNDILMNDTTQTETRKKLSLMKANIGYAEEFLGNEKMDERYNNLVIDRSKFFESYLNLTLFNKDYVTNELRLPINERKFNLNVYDVSGTFVPSTMIVEIPAGVLQGQFFHPIRPMYMNYGKIGTIIGHEIMHAFTDGEPFYDSKTAQNAYLNKANCIKKQYSNYTNEITGWKLNGSETLNEDIADIGGTKLSYQTYRQWVANNSAESKLPNLNYTNEQMFWISFAQAWCGIYRKHEFSLQIHTTILKTLLCLYKAKYGLLQDKDPHSPSRYRVIGVLSNLKEFASDFNCPIGSSMNPKEKCEFW